MAIVAVVGAAVAVSATATATAARKRWAATLLSSAQVPVPAFDASLHDGTVGSTVRTVV